MVTLCQSHTGLWLLSNMRETTKRLKTFVEISDFHFSCKGLHSFLTLSKVYPRNLLLKIVKIVPGVTSQSLLEPCQFLWIAVFSHLMMSSKNPGNIWGYSSKCSLTNPHQWQISDPSNNLFSVPAFSFPGHSERCQSRLSNKSGVLSWGTKPGRRTKECRWADLKYSK